MKTEELLELVEAITECKPVTPLINAGDRPFGVILEMAEELLRWRRLYLDQPEDRLYHAKDQTWWTRNDETHLGVGALYGAPPPPEVSRAFAARALLKKLVEVCDETNAAGEPAIGEDHTGTVNWLLEYVDECRRVVE